MEKITVFIDGGSRGNPGPSACGVVFTNKQGIIKKYSEHLGQGTNNFAEYSGLIFALKKAKALFGKEKVKKMDFEIKSDSELLVKQMKGEYKVLNPDIQPLFLSAWNLKIDFNKVSFISIPREQNKLADQLVNESLNAHSKTQKLF